MVSAAAKQQFLDTYEREHATTMRVLRAYPADQAELRPHPKCKTARELAWVFALERGLGRMVLNDELATRPPSGGAPPPPAAWDEVLEAVERSHREFGDLVRSLSEGEGAADGVPVVPAPRRDSPSRPVLDLPADGEREGAVHLRAVGRRAVDVTVASPA
jgi:hypothetical protein